MKKTFALLSLILISTLGAAQIQHGYVKTIGRPDKPGTYLSNVVIQALGKINSQISDSNGHFEIAFPEKKDGDPIIFTRVEKNGYEIHEKNKEYTFSSQNDIYIYMVDLKQLEDDRQRIEENALRVAEEYYQKKLADLEKRKKESEITIAQFEQEKSELEGLYKKQRHLAYEFADRYARTNYDSIDSLTRVINMYIENGELIKADSLIRLHFNPDTAVEENKCTKETILERIEFYQRKIDELNAELDSILLDIERGKQLASTYEDLANGYNMLNNKAKATECLEESLKIKSVIYGEDSQEAKEIIKQIEEIKK